jgi:hypothetical protein
MRNQSCLEAPEHRSIHRSMFGALFRHTTDAAHAAHSSTTDRRPLWLQLDEAEDRELLRQLKWQRLRRRGVWLTVAAGFLCWVAGPW